MKVKERITAPVPGFFRKLQLAGLALSAVSGALLTAPVSLPAAVISIAGYIALAGGIISAVSQMTVEGE